MICSVRSCICIVLRRPRIPRNPITDKSSPVARLKPVLMHNGAERNTQRTHPPNNLDQKTIIHQVSYSEVMTPDPDVLPETSARIEAFPVF